MKKNFWIVASVVLGTVVFGSPAAMADAEGQGTSCVTVRNNKDGHPWIYNGNAGFSIENISKYYYWLDHNHLCYGGRQFRPSRPS